jgi:hypothetical protein
MQPDLIWSAALGELQLQMTQATFDTWLRDSRFLNYGDGSFTIGVKSSYAKDWLENRLYATVKRTLSRLAGEGADVTFVVLEEKQQDAGRHKAGGKQPDVGQDKAGGKLTAEGVYGDAVAAVLQSERAEIVSHYNIDNWLPALGTERWGLVVLVRRLLKDAPSRDDGTRRLDITREELAQSLGIKDPDTISRWLKSEPIPERKGWRRIEEVDEQSKALKQFIPYVRYRYHREGGVTKKLDGYVLYIRMDDPVAPQDRVVKLPRATRLIEQHGMVQGTLGLERAGTLQDSIEMIKEKVRAIEPGLGRRALRTAARPIAREVELLLDDEGSMRFYLKVLETLHPQGRLDLFNKALETAGEIGTENPEANLGRAFVEDLRLLAEEEGIDVGMRPRAKKD